MADNAAEPLKVQVPLCVRCYTQHREYRGVTGAFAQAPAFRRGVNRVPRSLIC